MCVCVSVCVSVCVYVWVCRLSKVKILATSASCRLYMKAIFVMNAYQSDSTLLKMLSNTSNITNNGGKSISPVIIYIAFKLQINHPLLVK